VSEPLFPWVSRGGVKLDAGLSAFGIDPKGRVCLDVGSSTGGFTDVLLSRGAARVYAWMWAGPAPRTAPGDPEWSSWRR